MFEKDQPQKTVEEKKQAGEDSSKPDSETLERLPRFTTLSGMEIKDLYTPDDLANRNYSEEIGLPGAYPFTRGVQPSMYRGRLWTMRMFSGLGGPEETNQRFHYLLSQGETGPLHCLPLSNPHGLRQRFPYGQGGDRKMRRGHRYLKGYGDSF